MQVKIDTKEKFIVVLPLEPHIYDNMTVELAATCEHYLQNESNNVILNLQSVTLIDDEAAKNIAILQNNFYDRNLSFVICNLKPAVEEIFDRLELSEYLNITPSESEAWDIVQMEEIERELLDFNDPGIPE